MPRFSAQFALVASVLSGCIAVPMPADVPLTGTHVGTVVDADSGTPVQGAVVRFQAHPNAAAVSNAEGVFRLEPVLLHSSWSGVMLLGPTESVCIDTVTIEAPGYQTTVVNKSVVKPGRGNCSGVNFEYRVSLRRAT